MLTKCQKKYKRPIYSRKRVSVRSADYQEASYMCNRRKISKEHFLCQNRQRRHLYYKQTSYINVVAICIDLIICITRRYDNTSNAYGYMRHFAILMCVLLVLIFIN